MCIDSLTDTVLSSIISHLTQIPFAVFFGYLISRLQKKRASITKVIIDEAGELSRFFFNASAHHPAKQIRLCKHFFKKRLTNNSGHVTLHLY